MKKSLSLLLSLLMIISTLAALPFSAQAETNSFTVGEPTGISWGLPCDQRSKYSKGQYIISKNNLISLKGKELTKVRWYFYDEYEPFEVETTTPYERNVEVYLTEVSENVITSLVDVSSSTCLYNGIWTLADYGSINGISAAYVDVSFNTPYSYGGNNLLVTVIDKTGSKCITDAMSSSPTTLCSTKANGGYLGYSDSSSFSASSTSAEDSLSWGRVPVTTFYYTATNPEPTFTVAYYFNGGTKDGKGTLVRQEYAYAPDITAANFIDHMGVTPPAGKVLDAIEINGTRYELGSSYLLNQDTTYKYIWKDTGAATAPTVAAKKITSATLSKTAYTYDGKAKKPTVTVKYDKTVLKKDKDYTVTYAKGRKNVGAYKVTVQGKGNYTGTKVLTFKINPKGTSVSKVTTPKKRQLKVYWKMQATQTTGYQIQYSTSSKFKNAKTVTVKKNKTTKTTVKKLKAKKKYYVRIRTYKTVGKKKYCSSWSKAKAVKTK